MISAGPGLVASSEAGAAQPRVFMQVIDARKMRGQGNPFMDMISRMQHESGGQEGGHSDAFKNVISFPTPKGVSKVSVVCPVCLCWVLEA